MRCEILHEETIQKMEEEINLRLADSWKLQGGLSYYQDNNGFDCYHQLMTTNNMSEGVQYKIKGNL